MKKLAIIGASTGQQKICEVANKMGIYTIGFAWENGAVCKNLFSKFSPISISEMDEIVRICKEEKIDGIVSNGSDYTAKVVNYVANKLQLCGNKYEDFIKAQNKYYVRDITNNIKELTPIRTIKVNNINEIFYPCVMKPSIGSSKKGVNFIENKKQIQDAYNYAKNESNEVIIEEFVTGKEISVECLSYKKTHKIIQITDKETTGAPHFVELSHQQPAKISNELKNKLNIIIPKILNSINIKNGASHIELKINDNKIYLIEVNCRGGGDKISDELIYLSTEFDYIKAIVEIALDIFKFPKNIDSKVQCGICFLCKQNEKIFNSIHTEYKNNIIECNISSDSLIESTSNYDRNGYIIYRKELLCKKEL